MRMFYCTVAKATQVCVCQLLCSLCSHQLAGVEVSSGLDRWIAIKTAQNSIKMKRYILLTTLPGFLPASCSVPVAPSVALCLHNTRTCESDATTVTLCTAKKQT